MYKKSFLDRFIEKAENFDSNSRQTYILRLAKERGFFETIFNSIGEGILIVDKKLHIRYHNNQAKELLGLPENLKDVRLSQFFHNINWAKILSNDENEWLKVSHQEIEIIYPESKFIQFCLLPLEEDTSMAACVLRDVTNERKNTLNAIDNTTTEQVAMLAGSVAHEIGNPLNSIYLNLQLLERASQDDSMLNPEERAEMISNCRLEVERLDNIITQFLGAIRPREINIESVSIDTILLEVLNFMRQEIELKKIAVKCDFPEKIPLLTLDKSHIKQAFYNIIKNALEATNINGNILIKISYNNEYLTIEFEDSGNGINAKQINEIFTPFKTFKAKGNGLGMMIVERIAREHGAELSITSKENSGTNVSLNFRRHPRKIRVLNS